MKEKHLNKVAYHDGFGPFALPLVVAERFCELAGIQLDLYERSKVSNVYYIEDNIPRHDKNLIQAIQEFPRECAKAQVFLHYLEGDKYIITNHDGLEEVKEPADFDWVYLQTKGANQMSTELEDLRKANETLHKENENLRKILAPFRQMHDKIETLAKKNGKTFHDVMNTLDEVDKKHMEKIIDGSEFTDETDEQKIFWLECYYSSYAQNLMAKIFYDGYQNILQSDKNPE